MLEDLVSSGRIVDIMLAFVVVEVALLLLWRALRGGGIPPSKLLINIGAGGSLMLALKAVFANADWTVVAGCLVLALVFHVSDLATRWESKQQG